MSTLWSDDFSGDLTAYEQWDGSTTTGTWYSIVGGKLHCLTNGTANPLTCTPKTTALAAFADGKVSVTIYPSLTSAGQFDGGPTIRWVDGGSFYGLDVYNSSGWRAELIRYNPTGANTTIATVGVSAPADGDILTITAQGTTITGYINGTQVVTATDSSYTSGRAGVHYWGSNGEPFDDLLVEDLVTSTVEQEGYRWRNDDGSESTATWLASQDTNITQPVSTNTRLRVILNATGDFAANQYQLEYKKSTGSTYGQVYATQPVLSIPTFVAKGTFTSGTAALTVPVPAGYADNDIFLLFVESANEAITTPTGWTQVTNSPQSTGTAATAGGVRLAVFWKLVSGAQSSVAVADSGNHTTAIIMCFRGCDTTTPINITAGGVDAAATSALSCPAVTTTANNCLIVNGIGLDKDLASTNTLSGAANASLSSVTEQHDQTVASGAGGGIAVITGGLATAGSSGNTTATGDTSTTHAYVTVALAPATPSTEAILLGASANISSGGTTATTAQLTAPSGKTSGTNFQAGEISDDTNPLPSIDLLSDAYTELEWCLTAVSVATSAGDVFQFRVTAGGTPIGTYTVTPQWTIGSSGGGGSPTNTTLMFFTGF